MDPERFLELARILKGGPGTPENYRTAISRAYYAAFHVGVTALKAIGIRASDGPGGHGEVVSCLGACGDSDLQEASMRLKILHGRRRQADYKLSDLNVETRQEADLACLDSKEIIDQINNLQSKGSRGAAISEMRQFARDILKLQVN